MNLLLCSVLTDEGPWPKYFNKECTYNIALVYSFYYADNCVAVVLMVFDFYMVVW